MAKHTDPDPLAPAHIEGQNPATPERLPGHTGYFSDRERATAPRPSIGTPAFLFRSGQMCALSRDQSGESLPRRSSDKPRWTLSAYITVDASIASASGLTLQDVASALADPGYLVWRGRD